jgi:hypothetical protein
MSARKKLNSIHVTGALVVAGIAGLATGSWAVFLIGAAVLLGLGCYSGNIRPRGRGR